MSRALLWLLAGCVLFVLAVLVTAPELLGAEERQLAGLAGVAIAAGVPGIVIVLVLAAKRHSPDPDAHARPVEHTMDDDAVTGRRDPHRDH